jgi:hypothetical protein
MKAARTRDTAAYRLRICRAERACARFLGKVYGSEPPPEQRKAAPVLDQQPCRTVLNDGVAPGGDILDPRVRQSIMVS